ncbi:MAG: aromatic ring-hydroxylating dioxygenase subunit alpha [Alphaproteobacteria bacterium]|nr:aromatic ring-hydroxylating dioxygenase subunit alpha [Alphaproteobacteria bacterium]
MDSSLQSVIGAQTLAAFEATVPVAHGLPAAAYTSEAFFALENERIFTSSWVLAGFKHELARPGDAMPATVAGRPVLLLRDTAGQIRAFHNVCRHRCLKLVDEPGNVGRAIRCPYHSWTYGLDGGLRAAPYFGGREPRAVPAGFDRSQHGLVPVRSAVWHDWIFVNLDGGAPPFEEFVAPLRKRLHGLNLDRVQHLSTIDFGEVAANWKLLMENFIEPYHVQFVHSRTTDQPLADHYTVNELGCLGCAVDVSREVRKVDVLSEDSRFLTLFPNFAFGLYLPDQVGVHLDTPLAPGRTLQRRAIYSLNPTQDSSGRAERLTALWRDVHREDHAMCERLQQGRASDVAAGGGVLSPVWEDSVRNFQELVIERLR